MPNTRRLRLLSPVALLVLLLASAASRAQESQPPMTRASILRSVQDVAVQRVIQASRSDEAGQRANAIEAMLPFPDRAIPLAQAGLTDGNEGVRYVALVALGRLEEKDLAGAAAKIAADADQPLVVRGAAAFAAHKGGAPVDMSPLIDMLFGRTMQTRGNAANLLGWQGERSAIPMLREAAREPLSRATPAQQRLIALQIAEALVRLGEDKEIEPIQAGLFSKSPEVMLLAAELSGRLDNRNAKTRLVNIQRGESADYPIEVRLAAATALARIGWNLERAARGNGDAPDTTLAQELKGWYTGLDTLLDASRMKTLEWEGKTYPADSIRAQAAAGLSMFPDPRAAAALADLLRDESPRVRLSAAASVIQAIAELDEHNPDHPRVAQP